MTENPLVIDSPIGVHALASRHRYLALSLISALLVSLLVQLPRLVDPYQVEDDFRNHYWLHLIEDPELFSDDVKVEKWIVTPTIGSITPIVFVRSAAYSLIFQAANRLLPIIFFGKLLIFPLTFVAVFFLFRIGESYKGPRFALLLCLAFLILNMASPTSISTTAGLQRSFILPLLLGTVFYLMDGQDKWAAVLITFASLIYPPAFILSATTYGLSLLRFSSKKKRFKINWSRARPLIVAVLVSFVLLIPTLYVQLSYEDPTKEVTYGSDDGRYARVFKPATDGRHVLVDTFYKEGNPGQLFNHFPLVGRAGIVLPGMAVVHIIALALLAISISILIPKQQLVLPKTLKALFFASWLCFGLAWLFILLTSSFIIYLPSRYTEASLFLFLLIFVALNAEVAIARAAKMLNQRPIVLISVTVPIMVVALVVTYQVSMMSNISGLVDPSDIKWPMISLVLVTIILIGLLLSKRRRTRRIDTQSSIKPSRPAILIIAAGILMVSAIYVYAFQPRFVRPTQDQRELYKFIQTLPRYSRLNGAKPNGSNGVMLYGKRQVGDQCPLDIDGRLLQLQAYYATLEQRQTIVDYCQLCDVDYLIIDQSSFNADSLAAAKSRFDGSYLSRFYESIGPDKNFAMKNIPDELLLFKAGYYSVVACDERLG